LYPQVSLLNTHDQASETYMLCNPPQNITDSTTVAKYPPPLKNKRPVAIANDEVIEGRRFIEASQLLPSKPSRDVAFDMEDLAIPWNDLVLKEKIGSGTSPL
jgi:serine/threonine-protein kinase CTR1